MTRNTSTRKRKRKPSRKPNHENLMEQITEAKRDFDESVSKIRITFNQCHDYLSRIQNVVKPDEYEKLTLTINDLSLRVDVEENKVKQHLHSLDNKKCNAEDAYFGLFYSTFELGNVLADLERINNIMQSIQDQMIALVNQNTTAPETNQPILQ